MAFKIVSSSPNAPKLTYTADASISVTTGFLGYRDVSTGEIKVATTTTGDATNIECVFAKTETTAASAPTVEAYRIMQDALFVVDCTNTTAANQLNKAHLLTDGGTVNNTDTHSTDINAIFIALGIVGAAADKKLLGYIAKTGQVTA